MLHGVVQYKPFDSFASAPAGLVSITNDSVVPRVIVAHPVAKAVAKEQQKSMIVLTLATERDIGVAQSGCDWGEHIIVCAALPFGALSNET